MSTCASRKSPPPVNTLAWLGLAGTVAVALIPYEEDIKFMAEMKTSAVFLPFNVAASRLFSVVEGGKTHSLS